METTESQEETNARRRSAAEQPLPRNRCPGCLASLAHCLATSNRGWCTKCYPDRDAILSQLLRVPDPKWHLSKELRATEAEIERLHGEARALRQAAEDTMRRAAEAEAAFRYELSFHGVCLECRRAKATRTKICLACQDKWHADQQREEQREQEPCEICGLREDQHEPDSIVCPDYCPPDRH